MSRSESVFRTFEILEYLAESNGWVGLREIARDLDLTPPTAHRFLASLNDLGYIQQNPTNSRYRLSLKIAWLASKVLNRIQLVQIARPYMTHLTSLSNETSHLAILEDSEIVYLAKVDGNQAIRMQSRTGMRTHVHSTAVGKAILAFLPEEQRKEVLERIQLNSRTNKTITNKEALLTQLEEVRSRGYSVDDEENEMGIRCVGAPIFDHVGRSVGAISLSGWTITMTRDRLPQLAVEVMSICNQISQELGHYPQ